LKPQIPLFFEGKRVRWLFFISILFWAHIFRLQAQTHSPDLSANSRPFDFYERGPYRPDLPRPSDFFGYQTGDFLTTFALYESLLREYQEHSDRLRVFTIGQTPEHRTLYLLAVSSPGNLAHLDEIKEDLGKLADPRKLQAGPELDRLIQKVPIVVWLSYSIHGSESAAFEAGIQILYQLLASDDSALAEALNHTVVLINPCQNPDGHERFTAWYNAHGIGRPEHYAYEHQEPWSVTGRLNHNLFDLNRDLVSLSQPESQAATQAFLQWHPQVLADHHGQTKEYFFPPPALPINPNLPEKTTLKWLDVFGKSNAEAFDRYAWPYFARERFDLFYPGYWDSWSSLHGATGMTYETDGGGPLGYKWYRDDGTVLTLRGGIAKHFTADVATVLAAAANREARLRDFRDFFETTLTGLRRKYFLVPAKDSEAVAELVSLLLKQGIEVSRSSADIKILHGTDYFGGDPGERTIPAGSFLVDTAQPYGRMATALLEIETPQNAEFLSHQDELRKQNEARGTEEAKQDYEFYDVTAWSLPLAMGVEAYFTDEPVRTDVEEPVDSVAYPNITVRHSKGVKEENFATDCPEPGVAYAFEPASIGAMRMAISLLQQGYRMDTSNEVFRAAGKNFPRGSFILRDERNPGNLRQVLADLSGKLGVPVRSVHSAFPDNGLPGIGSEGAYSLKAPKVAILADEPAAQTSYGLMRFVLEYKCGVDTVPIPLENLTAATLGEINVLILPDGDAERFKKAFNDKHLDELRDWVSRGGVLICIGGASEFAADLDTKLTSSRLIGSERKQPDANTEKAPSEPRQKPARPSSTSKEAANHKPIEIPGAIVQAKVNPDHFLTFGYDSDALPLFVQGDAFFKPSETGANVLTFEGEKLKLSGFFWAGDTEQLLRGTCALIDEPIDAGNVILFNSEPGFRMIWTSTIRLLLNAIVYGPSQSRQSGN
jgi:hypothetical protein